jgi:hypothetical protein
MRFSTQCSAIAIIAGLAAPARAATITGLVTGPDGKPMMGAFVVAQDAATKKSISVLSNEQGRYVNLSGPQAFAENA